MIDEIVSHLQNAEQSLRHARDLTEARFHAALGAIGVLPGAPAERGGRKVAKTADKRRRRSAKDQAGDTSAADMS